MWVCAGYGGLAPLDASSRGAINPIASVVPLPLCFTTLFPIKYLSVMCLQGEERKWAEKDLRNLGLEKAARNYEESKLKPISLSKENKIVSLLEL